MGYLLVLVDYRSLYLRSFPRLEIFSWYYHCLVARRIGNLSGVLLPKDVVPFPLELDQHFIAAVLTVIGFSMNDTVIVFDRIREYSRQMTGATKETIINKAINDTLSRTIMTS